MPKSPKKITHKQPRWFKEQKQKKRKSFFLFLRPLGFLVLLILVGFLAFRILGQIKTSRWDGLHNFNFTVLAKDQIYIISYHPTANSVNILELPPQTYLPLSHSFGEYPVSSIWGLGEQEKIGGGNLLQSSCQYFLGAPIQGWGKINEKLKNQNEKLNKSALLELMIRLGFSDQRNLTLWDLVRLGRVVNSLPPTGINFYSLAQTRAGEEIILPDGSQVFRIQKEFLEKLSGELFADNDFLKDGIIWGVVNQTDFAGMAVWTARMINNIGGDVAFFEDEPEPVKEGIYCGQDKICESYSAKLLSESLHLPLIKQALGQARAEAVIVLGEDHRRFFYQR